MWKEFFSKSALKKGYYYFKNGNVINYNDMDGYILANVIDDDTYSISISFLGDDVDFATCTCNSVDCNCKHIASVLYYMDNIKNKEKSKIKEEKEINNLIDGRTNDELKEFLKIILHDEKIKNFYKVKFNILEDRDIDYYKNKVNSIIKYNSKCGFIEDCFVNDFYNQIYQLIDIDIAYMIDNGKYKFSFDILIYIFNRIKTLEIDDSDGSFGCLFDDISNLWKKIINLVSIKDKDDIFGWFDKKNI